MSSLFWYPGHDLALADIVRAENCTLHDARGGVYTDLESGVWCLPLGHAHPAVLRVLAGQAGRIAHTGYCYSSAVVEEAARDVLDLLDFAGGKCVFLCSGSEAVEYGVRAARQVAQRPLLMTMTDSYCGSYGSAWEKRPEEWCCFDWAECRDCPYGFACSRECPRWAAIPFADIGGFLFEPGSSSGFVRFPPAPLITRIVAEVRAAGGLVVVNEVTTGIGRTGRWFGFQHYGIAPDIVAIGKGIGNGYPVSLAAFAPAAAARLAETPLHYAQSHQNDPLGAAVAAEVLRVIRAEGLIERAAGLAQLLADGLQGVSERTGKIREVRARGLMVAIELADDADGAYTARLRAALLSRGYLVAQRPGRCVLRVDPSLTVERASLEGFLDALESALDCR